MEGALSEIKERLIKTDVKNIMGRIGSIHIKSKNIWRSLMDKIELQERFKTIKEQLNKDVILEPTETEFIVSIPRI